MLAGCGSWRSGAIHPFVAVEGASQFPPMPLFRFGHLPWCGLAVEVGAADGTPWLLGATHLEVNRRHTVTADICSFAMSQIPSLIEGLTPEDNEWLRSSGAKRDIPPNETLIREGEVTAGNLFRLRGLFSVGPAGGVSFQPWVQEACWGICASYRESGFSLGDCCQTGQRRAGSSTRDHCDPSNR